MFSKKVACRLSTSLLSVLATAAITACGGGSGVNGETASAADVTTPTAATATTSDNAAAAGVVATVAESGAPATTNDDANPEATIAAVDTENTAAASAASTSASLVKTSVTDGLATAPVEPTAASSTAIATPAQAVAASSSDAAATTASSAAASSGAISIAGTSATVKRPSYNTGTGFFVSGGKLYDATGHEFRVRGVNRVHWDNGSSGLPASGANTERIAIDFTQTTAKNLGIINTQMVANKIVPMPGNWNGTCKSDAASLAAIVDTWVAQAHAWTTVDKYSIINIANEWGPSNSTVWRDSYISAITRLRAAGYKGTLSITSGGCGQDTNDLVKYAQSVFDADPQKNVIFDLHVYGHFATNPTNTYTMAFVSSMTQLTTLHLPIVIGEFGPGRDIGPSPTLLAPESVVAQAEAAGFGWLGWAWDDNNLAACAANDYWFSMTTKCGAYKTDADLTIFGKTMVPIMKATAKKALVFG